MNADTDKWRNHCTGGRILIGFRVDANEMIATGHLMRCITMAREFLKNGEECLFFLAEEKETRRLEENGFDYQVIQTGGIWNQRKAFWRMLLRKQK